MTLTQINRAGLDADALDRVFTIGASGTDHYTFQGEGLNGTVNDPTLYLTRGKTYRFENGTGAHPIRIQSTSGASGTAYNTGVTNNAGSGTVIVEVQHDAPDVLYYQCTSHANMGGTLYITGALADGGVTTAKIAGDAVTGAKIADDAVSNEHIADNAVGSDAIANGSVNTLELADDAVTTAKIAAGAVGTTELANDSVTAAKIPDNAVQNEHIADNAVGSDAIANGSVNTLELADNAVTQAKINAGSVGTGELANLSVTAAKIANGVVGTSELADQGVTLAKLPHGTSSNNGKFLRANNGADPTFETVNTDLVSDTSPQLGGNLDVNGKNIILGDSSASTDDRIQIGDSADLQIYHDGSHSILRESGTGNLTLQSNQVVIESADGGETMATFTDDGDVQLRHNNAVKLYTNASGVNVDKCLQAGSVQSPIERDITHHQSFDPAGLFYPEGGYGNNNSPSNQRQSVIIGATKGNWVEGNSSSNHRSVGLKISRVVNSTEQLRAGIQHDINSTEKFKFWTSYGDIHFRTRNGNNGNQTWEECDRDPLIMHHNGHVSMMHMPRALMAVGGDNNSYSNDMTVHTVTGSTVTLHGGMTHSNGVFTVPYQGVYSVHANVGLHTNSSNTQRLDMIINGSNWQRTEHAGASGWQTQHITHVLELAANNTIEFRCAGKHDSSPFARITICMLHGTLTS